MTEPQPEPTPEEIIAHFAELLNESGVDSREVSQLRAQYDGTDVAKLMDTAMQVKTLFLKRRAGRAAG